jgi:monoamine oxidase
MMSQSVRRREYRLHHPSARAWAELDYAVNLQMHVTRDPCMPARDSLDGKHIVILGSGVGGLTTAYEILSRNSAVKVTVLEARDRTGGRCMTLRTGDTLTEDEGSALESPRGDTQVVRFEQPVGDKEPYLNAGPGRIPSSHKRLLDYLRRFGVEVEIYVMASESNMTQMEGGPEGDGPLVNRRLNHNTRGWIAQMVYQNAAELLSQGVDPRQPPPPARAAPPPAGPGDAQLFQSGPGQQEAGATAAAALALQDERVEQLKSLMKVFGQLDEDGRYVVATAEPGQDDNAIDRAGFKELPGVRPGVIADAIGLDRLLASEFWDKTRFYQPADFLWQPTLFQPVGGMDRVQHAFAQQVATLGGVVHLNSPVTRIDHDPSTGQFLIEAEGHDKPFRADYCFSNLAIPFLQKLLSPRLQALGGEGGFSEAFKAALHAVYDAQAHDNETERFLACTTKVGWQANRNLWQGKPFADHHDASGNVVLTADDSEIGVVPIYGGISWTDHPITQIWYPSEAYHDKKGVLTGCYNFDVNACRSGHMSVADRLVEARAGAARFGKTFSEGLEHGVAIAWQNMAHIKGGWAQWVNVAHSVRHYNNIIQGTGVDGSDKPTFFVVGDQVSSLPGWQEGAIASALNAISRMTRPDLALPHLAALPDTRLMVEGL